MQQEGTSMYIVRGIWTTYCWKWPKGIGLLVWLLDLTTRAVEDLIIIIWVINVELVWVQSYNRTSQQ